MLFHIIWGNRRTERTVGYVADFCPICREARAFRLVRVGSVGHIYYISFGAGKLVGHLIRCEECGTDIATEAARYATIEKKRPLHFSDLQQSTFPMLRTYHAELLAQEVEIRRSPRTLPPGVRTTAIIEPFRLLQGAVEARWANSTQMDKPAGIGCFLTTVITVGIIAGAVYFKGTLSDNILIAIAAVAGVGGLYTFVQLGLAPGRFVRARIIPSLARALDPLDPDEAELKECLKRCRDIRWKIGSKVKPKQILAEITRRRERMKAEG